MTLVLTLDLSHNILQPFYCRLLLRIKINRNVPTALLVLPYYMKGFNLKSLEIE